MAGVIKQVPAAINPGHPACKKPIWMAISVELGPGIKFVAPIRSRNSWSSSHWRRSTISRCIMAVWAAGPPKEVVPSLRNKTDVVRLVHGEQHPPVNRLQAVPDIGQRAPHDHAHRVIEVGTPHLLLEADREGFFSEGFHQKRRLNFSMRNPRLSSCKHPFLLGKMACRVSRSMLQLFSSGE